MNKLTWIVICKGGLVSDITVGDCIELTAALQEHHFRGSAAGRCSMRSSRTPVCFPPAHQRGSGRCGSKDDAASSRSSTSTALNAGPYATC